MQKDRKTKALLAMANPDINNLSPDVIKIISPYVIKILSENINEWESVPVLEKPYTRLLNDINSKKRIHKQSDWGPDECPAEENICGTPMCTAGHLVNMAGSVGYKLKDKYGWAAAAAMIHLKTHPDFPVQNFGRIPQDWALAYIEEMAERENEQ